MGPQACSHTMAGLWEPLYFRLVDIISHPTPRPGLQPIPGTHPLTVGAAVLPPLTYYCALLFLAPSPPSWIDSLPIRVLKNLLAFIAAILFFRLALAYHVAQSIGLTYQLGLVSLYGGCRVVDAFFISPYVFGHIPRRVTYTHQTRPSTNTEDDAKPWSDGGVADPYTHTKPSARPMPNTAHPDPGVMPQPLNRRTSFSQDLNQALVDSFAMLQRSISGPQPRPVYETAVTDKSWPSTLTDRATWALELELSMRGVGFTWTTADVRHTRKTWLPGIHNRLHSILFHVCPVLLSSWLAIRLIYENYLKLDVPTTSAENPVTSTFDELLPLHIQLCLTCALGAFLMAAFSLGHSLFAIMLAPLAPSPLAFFPPLYTTRAWSITSVRKFWSFGWHRLFARLFLVYGVWPGQWIERKLRRKRPDEPADIGKILGGFLASAFVHSFSVRCVLGGDWLSALGEAKFFALNGVAVVVEEVIKRLVRSHRKKKNHSLVVWYDEWIGRIWWITILLWTGRHFARGWVKANLVREVAFM